MNSVSGGLWAVVGALVLVGCGGRVERSTEGAAGQTGDVPAPSVVTGARELCTRIVALDCQYATMDDCLLVFVREPECEPLQEALVACRAGGDVYCERGIITRFTADCRDQSDALHDCEVATYE